MLVTGMGRASVLAAQLSPRVPTCRAGRGYVGGLSLLCQGQASTVLQSTSFAPCWLSPSQCTGKASPLFLAASRNSVQARAAPGKPLLLPGPVGWNPPCCLPHHASSGARTSGLVKRLRHCSRVKWPARAASLAEPGSSTHSNSLDSTNTNSLRRSLFFHTRAREQSSVRSRGVSPVKGHRPHTPTLPGWTRPPCWSNLAHPS